LPRLITAPRLHQLVRVNGQLEHPHLVAAVGLGHRLERQPEQLQSMLDDLALGAPLGTIFIVLLMSLPIPVGVLDLPAKILGHLMEPVAKLVAVKLAEGGDALLEHAKHLVEMLDVSGWLGSITVLREHRASGREADKKRDHGTPTRARAQSHRGPGHLGHPPRDAHTGLPIRS
jgi:hypothetical protein